MGKAKLNDIDGTGELNWSESNGVISSVGWFKPDRPEDINAFSLFCESTFLGHMQGVQMVEPAIVQVTGIDQEKKVVQLAPASIVWRTWITELKHKSGEVKAWSFKWPSRPNEEHAATMLQRKIIQESTLLPAVKIGEREPVLQRIRALGWDVTAIYPAPD